MTEEYSMEFTKEDELLERIAELENLIHAERKRQEQCDDIHLRKIAELEKENAELKTIADFQTSSNMDRYFQLKRSKEQLTKAKELLKQFLEAKNGEDTYKAEWEAEQFLNIEVGK